MPHAAQMRGAAVARLLRGAWRRVPDAPIDAADLQLAGALLPELGAAGLGWWRVRQHALKDDPLARTLHDGFRLHALQGARHVRNVDAAMRLLQVHRLRAVLIKGWAVARAYPMLALRPFGDLDLLVPPGQGQTVRRLLMESPVPLHADVHEDFALLEDRPFEDLWSRSQEVSCHGTAVRVLSAEDHLRLLGVHLLRHGATRPSWLCDVALLLEKLPDDFDWQLCLSGTPLVRGWLLQVFGLAVQLLGAHPAQAPLQHAPSWLVNDILRTWGRGRTEIERPALASMQHPAQMWHAMRERWTNRMAASVDTHRAFGPHPPLLLRSRSLGGRSWRFLQRWLRA